MQNPFSKLLDFFPHVLASIIYHLFIYLFQNQGFLQFLLKCKFCPKGVGHQPDVKKKLKINKNKKQSHLLIKKKYESEYMCLTI